MLAIVLMIIYDFEMAAAVEHVRLRRPVARFYKAKRGPGFATLETIMNGVCSSSTYFHASLIEIESGWCDLSRGLNVN